MAAFLTTKKKVDEQILYLENDIAKDIQPALWRIGANAPPRSRNTWTRFPRQVTVDDLKVGIYSFPAW